MAGKDWSRKAAVLEFNLAQGRMMISRIPSLTPDSERPGWR